MRRFICIEYFQGLPRLCFADVKSVEGSVKVEVEDIRGVEGIKVDRILRRTCVGETSCYSRLLPVSSEVYFISL